MKKNITLIILLIISIISTTFFLTSCNKVEKLIYKVENITYDGQYITWNKTELSDYYYVQINGGNKERSNSTTYAYSSTETFEVTITAVSDGDDKASDSVTFKPLSTIENIVVNEAGELSWEPISGANAYSLLINPSNPCLGI